MADAKSKLSGATLAALMGHLGQDATPVSSANATSTTGTAGISQKVNATEGLDVEALQHVRNTNAGMFFASVTVDLVL